MEIHKFSAGEVQFIGHVLKITFLKDEMVNLDDMKELTKIRESVYGENPYCSLIDLRKDFSTLDEEAKEYSNSFVMIKKLRIAEALLVKNHGQRLGATVFTKLFRANHNTRVFTDEKKALEWLNEEYSIHMKAQSSY